MRCALLYMLEAVEGRLCSLEVLEAMLCMLLCMLEVRCMLLRMLDAVEGVPSFRVSIFPLWQFSRYNPPPLKVLEVPEVMCRVLLCMLETVEGGLCLREVEVMRCMPIHKLEAMNGRRCLLTVLEVLKVMEVPEMMRCVLLCMLKAWRVSSVWVFRNFYCGSFHSNFHLANIEARASLPRRVIRGLPRQH